jgi:hypothetical protein
MLFYANLVFDMILVRLQNFRCPSDCLKNEQITCTPVYLHSRQNDAKSELEPGLIYFALSDYYIVMLIFSEPLIFP